MDTGLSQRDKLTINDILSKYSEIKAVRLFGSRAKGNGCDTLSFSARQLLEGAY